MLTMLYDAETLEPQLLIEEDIEDGDIGKGFWVINGCWGGTFNGDSIVIHSPFGDNTPATIYKCFKFIAPPPKEYFDLFETYYPKDFYNGIPYEPWFAHYRDLLEAGEVKNES